MIGGNTYRSALENMHEAVYIHDLDNRIIYMNPASETLTGWSLKEARGKKYHEIFGDATGGTDDSREQGLTPRENLLKTRSGEVRRVLQSISPLFKGKNRNGAIVVLREIARRKHDEEEDLKPDAQVRQAGNAEGLNETAGSIAHNVNNLLMMVLGNLELAQGPPGEESEKNKYILNAKNAAKQAVELNTSMLPHAGQSHTENAKITLVPPPERHHKPESKRKPGKIATVLLVDEDEVVLELGKDMLEELDFSVITALSGRQAVDVFSSRQNDINCIMLDMNMPDISVDHTLREIYHVDPDIPVLISTGYADNSMKELLQNMSVAGFIPKPYTLSKLSKGIKKTLDKK